MYNHACFNAAYAHTHVKNAKTRRSSSCRSWCFVQVHFHITTRQHISRQPTTVDLYSIHPFAVHLRYGVTALPSLRCLSPASSLELAEVFLFLPTRNRRVRSHSSATQDLLTVHRRSTSLTSLALSYQSDNRRASSLLLHQPYSAPLPFLTRIKTTQDAGRRLEEACSAWFSVAKPSQLVPDAAMSTPRPFRRCRSRAGGPLG